MSDQLKRSVRIVRPAAQGGDIGSRETIELELVSTGMLEHILTSDDKATKQKIRDIAVNDSGADGVLARNAEDDSYEIVDADGSADFSLVNTQMLQRMLNKNEVGGSTSDPVDDEPSFDPYNSD